MGILETDTDIEPRVSFFGLRFIDAANRARLTNLIALANFWTAFGLAEGELRSILSATSVTGRSHVFVFPLCDDLFWIPGSLVASWAVGRLPWPNRSLRYVVPAHLLVAVILGFAETVWFQFLRAAFFPDIAPNPFFFTFFVSFETDLLIYVAIVCVLYAAEAYSQFLTREIRNSHLRTQLAGAEFASLGMQVQPHFLFNTLQTIAELLHRDPVAARTTLMNLRALLQRSIERTSQPVVTLREELSFVASYFEIQQLRFRESLRTKIACPDGLLDALVPPMILQPLVENAIRHGTSLLRGGGTVTVSASGFHDGLRLTVENDGPDLAEHPESNDQGIGIPNTRSRLEHIYGGNSTLEIRQRQSFPGTLALIDVPLVRSASQLTGARSREAAGGVARSNTPRTNAKTLLRIIVGWLVVAIIWTGLELAAVSVRRSAVSWTEQLWPNLLDAAIWAFLTPIVFGLAHRVRATEKPVLQTIAIHACMGLGISGIQLLLLERLLVVLGMASISPSGTAILFVWNLAVYSALVAAVHLTDFKVLRDMRELQAANLESAVALTRLDLLKLQLHPTFLARTLEMLANLAESQPERCERLIISSSQILRGFLAGLGAQAVTTVDEIRGTRGYLEVEEENFESDLTVRITVSPSVELALVPSMILQPLIARALRPQLLSQKYRADLEISIDGDSATLQISVSCQRSCVIPTSDDGGESRMGYVDARLRELFGEMFDLTVEEPNQFTTRVVLVLPARFAPADTSFAGAIGP